MSSSEFDKLSRLIDDGQLPEEGNEEQDSLLSNQEEQAEWEEQAILSEMLHQHYNPEKSGEKFVQQFEVYRDKQDDAEAFIAATMQRIERLEKSPIKVLAKTPRLKVKQKPLKQSRVGSHNLSWKSWSALAAVFMAGILFQAMFEVGPPSIAELKLAQGEQVEIRRGIELFKAGDGTQIQAGDVLKTHTAHAKIQFHDEETYIDLNPSSELMLVKNAKRQDHNRVLLNRGKLTSQIAKRDKDNPLVFITPHMVTTILGTKVEITAGGRKDSIKVIEGKVNTLDLLSHERYLLTDGDSRIADAGYAMPLIAPLDSIVYEEFKMEQNLSLAQAKRKFLRRSKLYREVLEKIEIDNEHEGTRYGRVKGYIIPPQDGLYTFNLNSHDKAEFMLATESIHEMKSGKNIKHVNFIPKHNKGQVELKKGQRYLFQLHYVFQNTDEKVHVKWKGPGFAEKTLSNELIYSHFASVQSASVNNSTL